MANILLSDKELMCQGLLQNWQEEVILSKIKFKVVVASRQIGKTTTLKGLILKEALERPGIEIVVLASTLKQSKAIHFRPMFLSNDPIFDKHLVKSLNKTDLVVELYNGTRITCASTENIDALRGRTGDLVIIDEGGHVPLDDVLEIMQPVVSTRNGSIIIVGTPSGKAHPFYRYHQKGILGSPHFEKGFRSWTITIEDADVPNKDMRIEQAQRILSPFQYAQEYMCSFDAQEGLVYKFFDDVHNRSDKVLDTGRAIHIGIDFNVGVMNACVGQIYVDSGIEYLHIVDEIRLRNTNTQELVKEIKRRYAQWTGRIVVYPDASGNQSRTSAGISVTDKSILTSAGFNVQTKNKNPPILDRVNNLNAKICNAAGKRQLFIHPKCKYLIEALTSQVFDENGKPVKGIGEADLSGPNDALGYLVHSRYNINNSFAISYNI